MSVIHHGQSVVVSSTAADQTQKLLPYLASLTRGTARSPCVAGDISCRLLRQEHTSQPDMMELLDGGTCRPVNKVSVYYYCTLSKCKSCDVQLTGVCGSIKNPVSKELLYDTIERRRWTPKSKPTTTAAMNSSDSAVGDSELMPPPAKIPKR